MTDAAPQLTDHVISSAFLATVVAYITGIIAPILGVLVGIMALVWYTIQIWESAFMSRWRLRIAARHKARQIAKLQRKEKIILAKLDALKVVQDAKITAQGIVQDARIEATKDAAHKSIEVEKKI